MTTPSAECDGALQQICRLTLQANFPSFRGASVDAGFYPYIGLTHTIRRRGSSWVLRISDHCRDAPAIVLEATALILGCKVTRRKPPAEALEVYRRFLTQPAVRKLVSERRLQRGRKRLASAHGKTYSLWAIFQELNRRFFHDQVEVKALGWGLRAGWSRLGHYDPLHQTITISPVLDSPLVPRRVLAFIVYHEMLHTLFPENERKGRRHHHPPGFRRAERAYPGYCEIAGFLRSFSGKCR